ncbi:putative plastid light harvesting protein [Pelagophyceae sp. CCMP2097]|nr:putative plastid light harvesting protein [Pelagophyceae sp. CCMP2097]
MFATSLILCASSAAALVAQPTKAARTVVVSAAAKDMVGVSGPLGFFDPLGLSKDLESGRLAFYKEAEIKHGRVAMLATVGFLVQESVHFTSGPFAGIDSPSYVSFEQGSLKGGLWFLLALAAGNAEEKSVLSFEELDGAWTAEQNKDKLWRVKQDRVPGDIGFDPLKIKPTNAAELKSIQLKEINNGRLAMIGIAGMIAQELVNGQKILV